VWNLSFNMPRV